MSRRWWTARQSRSSVRGALFLALALAAFAGAAQEAQVAGDDHRAWQHGVDLVRVDGRLLVVWGSAGDPPRPNLRSDWPHDIYYSWIDAPAATDGAVIEARLLVSGPEAQEPPSTAVNARGTILVTAEDGNGGINQHAGMWDATLRVRRAYPFLIRRGGHSGHAAAMGERFLVAYSEEWVKEGGFRGQGTGRDIHARIVEDDGTVREEIEIATGRRDDWPLVAGSERNWLVAWQRHPEHTLQFALIDAAGRVARRGEAGGGLPLRYAYSVDYAPRLSAYVLTGSAADGGFVVLVGLDGEILRTRRGLPPMASESRMVISHDGPETVGVYPVLPSGIAVVRLSAAAIDFDRLVAHPYAWDYMGTTGTFVAPGRVLFATLSKTGLRLIHVDVVP